jgi:hypothetical protein
VVRKKLHDAISYLLVADLVSKNQVGIQSSGLRLWVEQRMGDAEVTELAKSGNG